MKALQSLLSVAGILTPQVFKPSMGDPSSPSLPTDHPASIQFSAWVTAFNTGDAKTLLTYHSDDVFPYSVASHDIGNPERELMLSKGTGGFKIADIESISEPSSVVVILREKNRGSYARSSMIVDISKSNYPVTGFSIQPIITPIKFIPQDDPRRPKWEKALAPLNAIKRKAVVDGIIDVLRDQYVNPKLAEVIVDALDAHLMNGNYDHFEDSEKFAQQLTDDIHFVGHDLHMVIAFIEPRGDIPDYDKHGKPQKHLEDLRSMNFGFGNIVIDHDTVPGKVIATLPINGFFPATADFASDWQEIRKAIGDVLTSIAEADVLLVDLRSNRGGDPSTVAFILSYLLDDGPVHLLDFVNRAGKVEQSFSTIAEDELPLETRRFGGTKPVYVLTTNNTISGGEDMSYSLQAFKRSIAIIGERNSATAGAANPITRPRWICEEEFGNGWWLVAVPNLKPVHSVTGTNWEGVGVKSDVVAGEGKWQEVNDAEEVGRRMAQMALEQRTEL